MRGQSEQSKILIAHFRSESIVQSARDVTGGLSDALDERDGDWPGTCRPEVGETVLRESERFLQPKQRDIWSSGEDMRGMLWEWSTRMASGVGENFRKIEGTSLDRCNWIWLQLDKQDAACVSAWVWEAVVSHALALQSLQLLAVEAWVSPVSAVGWPGREWWWRWAWLRVESSWCRNNRRRCSAGERQVAGVQSDTGAEERVNWYFIHRL